MRGRTINLFSLLLLVLVASVAATGGYDPSGIFINPGLKIGWQFGEKSGMVVGAEISGGRCKEFGYTGVVCGYQYNLFRRQPLSYIEFEIGKYLLGGAAGVEFSGKSGPATRIRLIGGALLFLSYTYSFSEGSKEIDLVGKYPYVNESAR